MNQFSFKYVVLTAVSSEEQATEEHDSLPYQFKTAKAFGDRMGGTFVREYRLAGYSRSGIWDLPKAFRDIPPLGELARDAMQGKFDVIIAESFDRLGDLGFVFYNFLKPLRIQLRSVQQALPIVDPATYEPTHDDLTPTIINNSLNTNVYRIHKVTRAFAVGNAKRASSGKHGNVLPYGYIQLDKDTVVIDENVAVLLRKFPVWFLAGEPVLEIVKRANASGIPGKRGAAWTHRTVRYVLENPFYAGKTFYARGKLDSHGVYHVKPDATLHDGKHEKLWTWATYQRIQREFARRANLRQTRRDYNLTGLLKCSECGATLTLDYDHRRGKYKYWRCKARHVSIRTDRASVMVAAELQRLFADDGILPAAEQVQRTTDRAMADVRRQLSRLDQAYMVDEKAFEPVEYATKRKALLARQAELQDEEKQREAERQRQDDQRGAFRTMQSIREHFPQWVTEADPREVKFHLSRVVRLTAYPDKTITAELL